MRKSLVALDTDHIKKYVFATDTLKEIRGASSILDRLNRVVMEEVADEFEKDVVEHVYTNGGSGLFVVDTDQTDVFCQKIKWRYRDLTHGGSSITSARVNLSEEASKDVWNHNLKDELALLRYRLREEKDRPPCVIALPSHPFLRPCDACGVEYAERKFWEPGEPREALYCMSCEKKRKEDGAVKRSIKEGDISEKYLWGRMLRYLKEVGYKPPPETDRPDDFNEFRHFSRAKDYLGLIYADANSMGQSIEDLETLKDLRDFATNVDKVIHKAVSEAIQKYLPVQEKMFPFDILLIGGDDVLMVVPASEAMDVAYTIAEQFRERTRELIGKEYMLSVGVVLAPVKYPFGLLLDLVEGTLKAAKKSGTKAQSSDTTRINFATVMGTTNNEFRKVYAALHAKREMQRREVEFYATLRPYDLTQLAFLLSAIRKGHREGLGRTKLHQLREAILKMNLTTSVVDALSVLRNWNDKQRSFVVKHFYKMGESYQLPRRDPNDPTTWAFRNPFPWFADGKDTYRTSLLDFVELYDFVRRDGGTDSDEN